MKYYLIPIIFSLSISCWAQHKTWIPRIKYGEELTDEHGHNARGFIGEDSTGVFLYQKDYTTAVGYFRGDHLIKISHEGRVLVRKKINENKTKNTGEFLLSMYGGKFFDGRLVAFFTSYDKENSLYNLSQQEFNPTTLEPVNELQTICSVELEDPDLVPKRRFNIKALEDGNVFISLLLKGNPVSASGKMETWRFNKKFEQIGRLTLPYSFSGTEGLVIYDLEVVQNGNLLLFTMVWGKDGLQNKYYLIEVSKEGQELRRAELDYPLNGLGRMKYFYKPGSDTLHILIPLFAPKAESRISYEIFDLKEFEIISSTNKPVYSPKNRMFYTLSAEGNKPAAYLRYLNFTNCISRPGGGHFILCERIISQSGYMHGDNYTRYLKFEMTTWIAEAIIIIATDRDGSIEWLRTLPKRQLSTNHQVKLFPKSFVSYGRGEDLVIIYGNAENDLKLEDAKFSLRDYHHNRQFVVKVDPEGRMQFRELFQRKGDKKKMLLFPVQLFSAVHPENLWMIVKDGRFSSPIQFSILP